MSEGAQVYDLGAARRLKQELAAVGVRPRSPYSDGAMTFGTGVSSPPSGGGSIIIDGMQFTCLTWTGGNT